MRATPASGGTYQYSLSMLEALRHARGYDVTLYGDPSNPELDRLGFRIRKFVESRATQLTYFVASALGASLTDPFADEDILIAPTYCLALLHTARPFTFTLHDLQEFHYPANFSRAQRSFRRSVYLRLSSRAARIVCESEYVKADIVRLLNVVADEKLAVITAPPLDLASAELGAAELADVRGRLSLPDRFFFYPAQFWPHKNHLRLIEAFRQVVARKPDLKLVLTGRERDEYRAVMRAVREAGLERNVQHLGYIEQADLQATYHLAIALAMPSLFESVSIPIYEAFRAGTPVIASNIQAISEQVGTAGLLFDPLSSAGIAERMLEVIDNPELARTLSARGRERMAAITPQQYCGQLQELLDGVQSALRSRFAVHTPRNEREGGM
jgi:glycosyltransferase involved in cell wall biosynthesis